MAAVGGKLGRKAAVFICTRLGLCRTSFHMPCSRYCFVDYKLKTNDKRNE